MASDFHILRIALYPFDLWSTGGGVKAGELVGQRLGKYEILALIAVGGTAEIYLARIGGEAGFEKYLVVKCLLDHLAEDQEFVRMFLDEARLGAQLDHSNIVQTLELGQHKGRYYMVMEYLAGLSLAQVARKSQERVQGGLIPTNLVFGLAAQACSGLHYAHERATSDGKHLNLVHRDISPQNLVLTFEGVLKIVDFGIAKSDFRQTNTRTGTIKGKFAYMSPEQCLAKGIDRRTDIFALGTICHELLTGRRLFKRQTTYDTYQAIVRANVPKPSSINPNLDSQIDDVVMKALEYKRENRYETAQHFGEVLLGTLHERGTAVGPGDVSRFFDENFVPEIDEHGNRMRELITGKVTGEVTVGTWDNPNAEDAPPKVGIPPIAAPAASSTPKPIPRVTQRPVTPSGGVPEVVARKPPAIEVDDDSDNLETQLREPSREGVDAGEVGLRAQRTSLQTKNRRASSWMSAIELPPSTMPQRSSTRTALVGPSIPRVKLSLAIQPTRADRSACKRRRNRMCTCAKRPLVPPGRTTMDPLPRLRRSNRRLLWGERVC